MKMTVMALAVCGLTVLAPLVQTAVAQERPQYLDDECVQVSAIIASVEAGDENALEFFTREELDKWHEEAACDCADLRSSIAYIEDRYERWDFEGLEFPEGLDVDKYHRKLIPLLRHKFDQQCDERQAAQEQRCIIVGEYGGKTMGLGARPLEGGADSRIFVFLDQTAVEAAQSFVKELNKLDHEGDLPTEWELRCQ